MYNVFENLNAEQITNLIENDGVSIADYEILEVKFIKQVPANTGYAFETFPRYNVVVQNNEDDVYHICEIDVIQDSTGYYFAAFASMPLFESNDMSAIRDVFDEGAVALDAEFNPIPETEFLTISQDSDEVIQLMKQGR